MVHTLGRDQCAAFLTIELETYAYFIIERQLDPRRRHTEDVRGLFPRVHEVIVQGLYNKEKQLKTPQILREYFGKPELVVVFL